MEKPEEQASRRWAESKSKEIQTQQSQIFLTAILTILKSRLPHPEPPPQEPQTPTTSMSTVTGEASSPFADSITSRSPVARTRRTPLYPNRTPAEEAALQARIKEHMRHKIAVTRQIVMEDKVAAVFTEWRTSAVRNKSDVEERANVAVLKLFQERRERSELSLRAAEWIHKEESVRMGLDMLQLEEKRLVGETAFSHHEQHNILSNLVTKTQSVREELVTAERTSPLLQALLATFTSNLSSLTTLAKQTSNPIQLATLRTLSQALHTYTTTLYPAALSAHEQTHLTHLLGTLRSRERHTRLRRLHDAVRTHRRAAKTRATTAALSSLVSSDADLEARLAAFRLEHETQAVRAVLDFLNVEWRVRRIMCETAEARACAPVALGAMAAQLGAVDALHVLAGAQREVAERGMLKSGLVRWKLRSDQLRAREEIDKIQREMIGGGGDGGGVA